MKRKGSEKEASSRASSDLALWQIGCGVAVVYHGVAQPSCLGDKRMIFRTEFTPKFLIQSFAFVWVLPFPCLVS